MVEYSPNTVCMTHCACACGSVCELMAYSVCVVFVGVVCITEPAAAQMYMWLPERRLAELIHHPMREFYCSQILTNSVSGNV